MPIYQERIPYQFGRVALAGSLDAGRCLPSAAFLCGPALARFLSPHLASGWLAALAARARPPSSLAASLRLCASRLQHVPPAAVNALRAPQIPPATRRRKR